MFGKNSTLAEFSIVFTSLFVGLFLVFTLFHITNPIIFPHTYSYGNIILKSAEPIEESLAKEVLSDSYDRVKRSTLYEKDQVYNVHYPNNSLSKKLRFDSIHFAINKVTQLKNLIMATEYSLGSTIRGYVHTADHYPNAYVLELDPYVIAHEITHLMSKDAQPTPYHNIYHNLTKNPLEEGYAEIISNTGYEYNTEPEFLLASSISWHDGTAKYTYRDKISYNKYGYESKWVIYNLLKERDISEIIKDWKSSDRIVSEFLYNYLVENGYKKIEGPSTRGVLEGTWTKQ